MGVSFMVGFLCDYFSFRCYTIRGEMSDLVKVLCISSVIVVIIRIPLYNTLLSGNIVWKVRKKK